MYSLSKFQAKFHTKFHTSQNRADTKRTAKSELTTGAEYKAMVEESGTSRAFSTKQGAEDQTIGLLRKKGSDMQHTPGPWHATEAGHDMASKRYRFFRIECPDNNYVAELDDENTAIALAGNIEADARLIAAAPQMLEALVVALSALEATLNPRRGRALNYADAIRSIQAAIEAAKGTPADGEGE